MSGLSFSEWPVHINLAHIWCAISFQFYDKKSTPSILRTKTLGTNLGKEHHMGQWISPVFSSVTHWLPHGPLYSSEKEAASVTWCIHCAISISLWSQENLERGWLNNTQPNASVGFEAGTYWLWFWEQHAITLYYSLHALQIGTNEWEFSETFCKNRDRSLLSKKINKIQKNTLAFSFRAPRNYLIQGPCLQKLL